MGEKMAFLGGYLSWVPVVLNTASSPAIVLQLLLLAFHAELGLTMSIIMQLVILWTVVGLALAKLAANQRIMNVTFVVYGVLTLTIFVCGVIYALGHGSAHAVQPGTTRWFPTSPARASCTARCCCTWSVSRRRSTWVRSSCR